MRDLLIALFVLMGCFPTSLSADKGKGMMTMMMMNHKGKGGGGVSSSDSFHCVHVAFEFFWRGQFAGFIVNGRFSYNQYNVPDGGIVREENLLNLDVSFYDPKGRHLRTYYDNQLLPIDKNTGKPYLNFAFDALSREILQDGTWNVDDDHSRYRNGFMMGEGNPDLRYEPGVQSGLAFWTRPRDDTVPHLHVDDWNDKNGEGEFGFPIGFSTHEDASFQYETTQARNATGRIGKAYYDEANGINKLASDFKAVGQTVRVYPVPPTDDDMERCKYWYST